MDMPAQRSNPLLRRLYLSLLSAVIYTGIYVYIYQNEPFSTFWNDLAINGLTALAAMCGALFATLIWLNFEPKEPPRPIWGHLAVALWLWTGGEIAWAAYAYFVDEVPLLSMADFFWVTAYLYFAGSFYTQFSLLQPGRKTSLVRTIVLAILGVFAMTGLITLVVRLVGLKPDISALETVAGVFYPVADLVLALAAMRLARIFGRGIWGWTWFGLLVFVVSDAMYAAATFTGLYSYSTSGSNIISLLTDAIYVIAYLFLAIACLTQYMLVRHGPPPSPAVEYHAALEGRN